MIGTALKSSVAPADTPEEDVGLRVRYAYARDMEKEEIFRRHVRIQQVELTNFRGQHAIYLKTPEWAAKRGKVLARAKGVCEGCEERHATQVHHLTYEHWRDELLFELVAVCDTCHGKCHPPEDEAPTESDQGSADSVSDEALLY